MDNLFVGSPLEVVGLKNLDRLVEEALRRYVRISFFQLSLLSDFAKIRVPQIGSNAQIKVSRYHRWANRQ